MLRLYPAPRLSDASYGSRRIAAVAAPCNFGAFRSFYRLFRGEGGRLDTFILDFGHLLRYPSSNTPAPPLPLVGDAHPGQVFLCADGNLFPAAAEGTP